MACATLTCAALFLTGGMGFSSRSPWTDRVTEAQKAKLRRVTGLALPAGSRFLLYGEDDWLDEHDYYKLRLTVGELHTLLAQRPFQGASWEHGDSLGVGANATPVPSGWHPGRSRKNRTTQVNFELKPFERKPGEGKATYLDLTIDPNEDGTDDVYLELGYS